MNKKSQLQFAQRCAVLLESGISLSETLSIIIRMEKSKSHLKAFSLLQESVLKGASLSKSILSAKIKCDPTLIAMITYGESAGILALSLRQAGEIMEKKNELQKKLIGTLIYPAFIALATVGMTLFLVMYIFPKILPLLSSMDITLPLLTRAVKKMYEFLIQYGLWAFIFMATGAGIFWYVYRKNKEVRYKIQIILLVVPLIGDGLKKYFICIQCRSAGILLDCGQTLPAILEQAALSSTYEPYKKAWQLAIHEINRGISLSEFLHSLKGLFPSIVPDMLSIGEKTGTLSSMFHHVSRMYDKELDDFIKQLSTLIEPILMIIMGLIVGSVALSIILPIYEITNHL